MRRLEWTRSAQKSLRQIDKQLSKRIIKKVTEWAATDPQMHKQLEDTKGLYAYRVGDYRAIYELDDVAIWVVSVLKRGDSYKLQGIWKSRDGYFSRQYGVNDFVQCYTVRGGNNEILKIGITSNVNRRISQLKNIGIEGNFKVETKNHATQ